MRVSQDRAARYFSRHGAHKALQVESSPGSLPGRQTGEGPHRLGGLSPLEDGQRLFVQTPLQPVRTQPQQRQRVRRGVRYGRCLVSTRDLEPKDQRLTEGLLVPAAQQREKLEEGNVRHKHQVRAMTACRRRAHTYSPRHARRLVQPTALPESSTKPARDSSSARPDGKGVEEDVVGRFPRPDCGVRDTSDVAHTDSAP